jgi:hypothetical protein
LISRDENNPSLKMPDCEAIENKCFTNDIPSHLASSIVSNNFFSTASLKRLQQVC